MKTFHFGLVLLSSTLIAFTSCNKASSDKKPVSRFIWNYNNTVYTAKQDTAYTVGIGAPSIIAGLNIGFGDRGSGPIINLTSLTVGAYSFGSGTGNTFRFIDPDGFNIEAISGTLNITGNGNKLLSGSFNAVLYNNKTITGEFENTPIKP